MGGIKNKLDKLSNKTLFKVPLWLKGDVRRKSDRGIVSDTNPLGSRLPSFSQPSEMLTRNIPNTRKSTRWSLYASKTIGSLRLVTLTKYLSIACLSLAILSTLILNIISSYSSSKIESNAIDSNSEVSTLANDSSSISLSFSNATGSCSDTSNPANVCMSILDGGGIATGGHTVTVNAGSDIANYELKLSSKTEETALVNEDGGSNTTTTTIEPIAKTYTSVKDLDGFKNVLLNYGLDNNWAYFVISEGVSSFGFVSPMTPASEPKTILDSSTGNTDSRNIYYGARVDHPSTMLAGNYTAQIVYTVTATLHEPTIASISPTTYELGSDEGLDSSNRLPVTIAGNHLSSTSRVYLTNSNTTATNAGTEYDCTNIKVASDSKSLTCTLPTDKTNSDLEAGTYNLAVLADNGTAVLDNAFTYTKPSICRNGDPDSDCQVDIDDNMFPVAYDESAHSWYLVSKSGMERGYGSWYDYGDRKWANAVTMPDNLDEYCYYANKGGGTYTVTSAGGGGPCDYPDQYDIKTPFELASAYFNGEDIDCSTGDITMAGRCYISDFSALGFWTYIPRYAYQVMRRDATDKVVTDEEAIAMGGFNIKFETNKDTKKVPVACNSSNSNQYYQNCHGVSNTYGNATGTSWATHPAFTWQYAQEINGFDETYELNGFWIGKFETTGTLNAPTVKPGEFALTGLRVGQLYASARSIGVNDPNNKGGDTHDSLVQNSHYLAKATSHMLKNSEWGATAYLSASKYGAGIGGVKNNYSNAINTSTTGCGPDLCGNYATYGIPASTTNSVYGVYDMAGGSMEYVAGAYSTDVPHTMASEYFSDPAKSPYVDLYSSEYFNGDDFSNDNLCTWFSCGGQALYEVRNAQTVLEFNQSWNSDNSFSVTQLNSWFLRGGSGGEYEAAGIFSSYSTDGAADKSGFRVALLVPVDAQ